MRIEDILKKRDKYLMAQARHQLYNQPVVFERGDMELLYDLEGKEYIDCFSGIMVVNFGHCNPEINAHIHSQLDKLQHVSTFFLTEKMIMLAEKIADITPEGLIKSFFVNSGSEAVDSAILLARKHTGNELIVPVCYAYHGRTLLGTVCTNISPSGMIDSRANKLDIHFGSNGYCYRCLYKASYPECGLKCADDVRKSIAESGHSRIAGILVEPIQGVGGVITPPDAYLKALEVIAHEYGGLLIIDEVQSGFGRTGRIFYTNESDAKPDILCAAKGIANGIPMGVCIAQDQIGEAISIPTFSTFGGSPIASAAALASINYMLDNDIPGRARKSGHIFLNRLHEMQKEIELIGDIRGEGLLIGLELVKNRETKEPATEETLAILEECRKNGLIIGKSGPKTNIIRIGPPLVIREEYIQKALDRLEQAIKSIA